MFISEEDKILSASVSMRVLFNGALDQAEPDPVMEFTMEVESTGESEEYVGLGDVPQLQELVDEVKFSGLRGQGIKVKNKEFAGGLMVARNTIINDKLGVVRPKIEQLAHRARRHPAKRVVEALANGFDGADPMIGDGRSYDGAFFFSDSHQDGDGPVQSNRSTEALSHDSYAKARTRLQDLVDEYGEPLDVAPSHLLVGPELETTAREILENTHRIINGSPVSNIWRGTSTLLVSPRLRGTWAKYWFLADLTKTVRPLIHQKREAPRFLAQDEMSSEAAFTRRQYRYQASLQYNIGLALWQLCYGSTGAS